MARTTFRYQGPLQSWNAERGFGFVSMPDGAKPVFIHISELRRVLPDPKPGDRLSFEIAADADGRTRAVSVVAVDGARKAKASARLRNPRNSVRVADLVGPVLIISSFAALMLLVQWRWQSVPWWLPTLDVVASILAMMLYARDKRAARAGSWRVSENTLHLVSLIGGWPGALLAQQILRHKTRKRPFRVVFWLTVLANLALTMVLTTPLLEWLSVLAAAS